MKKSQRHPLDEKLNWIKANWKNTSIHNYPNGFLVIDICTHEKGGTAVTFLESQIDDCITYIKSKNLMKPGNTIIFDLETWNQDGELIIKEVTTEIIDLIYDPLGYHEPKAWIEYKGEEYGIPFSEVKNIIPTGDQLKLEL